MKDILLGLEKNDVLRYLNIEYNKLDWNVRKIIHHGSGKLQIKRVTREEFNWPDIGQEAPFIDSI